MAVRYRVDQLQGILSALCNRISGIDQLVVVSMEGFVVASHPPTTAPSTQAPLDSLRIAATAANAISLGKGALDRLEHGRFERLIIEGENGSMIVYPLDETAAALVAMVRKDAKLGMASLAMRQSVEDLADIIRGGSGTP